MSTKTRRRRGLRIAATCLLAGGVAAGTYMTLDVIKVAGELRQAVPLATQIKDQALTGDTAGLDQQISRLAAHTSTARQRIHQPHWNIAAHLPVIGDDIQAAQTITAAVDDIANGSLGPLVSAADHLPGLLQPGRDGRIDTGPLTAVADTLTASNHTTQDANTRVQAIDTSRLVGPLARRVDQVQEQVAVLADLAGKAAAAAQLAPAMLGADEPRHYLLLAQNNAEPRAGGGINGAVIHLRADDGRLDVVGQKAASDFEVLDEPVTDLDIETEHLFGTHVGRFMQNVTATPDFPTTGRITADLWAHHTGSDVDGVISIDPVALQDVIAATAPVRVPEGVELTGDNTAQVLLNQVYLDIADPREQDKFFERAATAAFDRLLDGGPDAIAALRDAAGEGRVKIWSARPDEQAILEQTPLAGRLTGHDGDRPVVGVYLNDRSGAKVGYYQDVDITAETVACHLDGSQDIDLTVTLTSTVPTDLIGKVPYLTGGGVYVPEGQIHTQLLVYAPTGGTFTAAQPAQGEAPLVPARHRGLDVISQEIALDPGESATATFRMTSGPNQPGSPVLKRTPGAPTHRSQMSPASDCR